MMKRMICAMLALAVGLLGFAAAEAMDVTGSWYLNVIETEGVQLDPAALGMEMSITLNADGSATMTALGEDADVGHWTISGSTVTVTDSTGDSMVAELVDGELVIAEESIGGSMVLGREKQTPTGYVPAAVESAPALSDFEGTWSAALIDMLGMQMSMEVLGMKLVIEISGETATVTSNESGADVSYEAPVSLEGSVLTVAAAGDEMPMELQLQQDGKLVFAEEGEGIAMYMYFEKIA